MNKKSHTLALKITFIALLPLLVSCTNPTKRILEKHHFIQESLQAGEFNLTLFKNRVESEHLHIYFGGDGIPFIRHQFKTANPTPIKGVTPKLMALDTTESVYIARPCYYLTKMPQRCTSDIWTDGRYSETVVKALTNAVRLLLNRKTYKSVAIIGFSGGGTLATLVAEQVPQITKVITIAANLDTDLWTTLKGYTPLKNSINPTLLKQLRIDIARIHLAGLKDRSVSISVINSFIEKHGGELHTFPDFNHNCCWESVWNDFLVLTQ